MLKAGDTFLVPFEDGRFGAVRVLRTKKNKYDPDNEAALIYATTYIDSEVPILDDPRIQEVLLDSRFRNFPAIGWAYDSRPELFTYIGHKPLSKEEEALNSLGPMPWAGGYSAYQNWKHINDKDSLEAEQKKAELKRFEKEKLRHKDAMLLDDDQFWELINKVNIRLKGKRAISNLVSSLAELGIDSINRFYETLAFKLYLLDTKEHAKYMYPDSYDTPKDVVMLSEDGFLYDRCGIIVLGQIEYEKYLSNPSEIRNIQDFELLLSVAAEAYKKAANSEYDYCSCYSFETFSNYDGWNC